HFSCHMSVSAPVSFSFPGARHHPHLHSFPTRRSSDLTSAGMGHVNAKLDDDGVVRGIHLRTGIGQPSWKHLTLVLNEFLDPEHTDRKSTRLNSSHVSISYAVFCLKKKREG